MFFGSVPTPCVEQLLQVVNFKEWTACYVCCSGSFRVEQALSLRYPDLKIYSNDVSLYSSAIAAYVLDRPFPILFKERLAYMEEYLQANNAAFIDRVAAIVVAHRMSRFAANNEYCRKHFAYYEDLENLATSLAQGREKLGQLKERLRIADYYCGDFQDHLNKAIEERAGCIAFPPFTKGAYEGHFRFLRQSVEWPEPEYALFEPEMTTGMLEKLEAAGLPHCILTEQKLEDRKPIIEYVQGRKLPHYCYGTSDRSSLRHIFNKPIPFVYTPIDFSRIGPKTKVSIVPAETKYLNYIKDVYLAKYIIHTSGMYGFFVYLDDMLAGGIIYALQKHNIAGYKMAEVIYLLSDVTTTTEGRVSKLVAMLAASRDLITLVERRLFQRIKAVITTVWTNKHCSMKYRGIYRILKKETRDTSSNTTNALHSTKPTMILYGSDIRQQSFQEVYSEWFKKYYARPNPSTHPDKELQHRPKEAVTTERGP